MSVMQTFTGRLFDPLNPDPALIDLRDIAHALGQICRFGGHIRRHYSVAEHSLLVASLVPDEFRLWALLHDSAEAYDLGDVIRPQNDLGFCEEYEGLRKFSDFEDQILAVILARFGLSLPMPAEVHHADKIALVTELRDLLNGPIARYDPDISLARPERISPLFEPLWPGCRNAGEYWLKMVCELAKIDYLKLNDDTVKKDKTG